MRRFTYCVMAAMAAGCAGAPTVTRVPVDGTPLPSLTGKGLFYYLPKTELLLKLELQREDYVPGRLARYVGKQCAADTLCEREAALNLKLRKPKAERALYQCTGTAKNNRPPSERRYSLTDKTQLTPVAVPDRDELYFVETTPAWYQKLALQVQLSETGFATEMTSTGSNAALASAGQVISSVGTKLAWLAIDVLPQDLRPADDDSDTLRQKTLDEIDQLSARRRELLVRGATGEVSTLLAAIDGEIEKLRARYEGKLESTASTITVRVPLDGLRDDSGVAVTLTDLRGEPKRVIVVPTKVTLFGCEDPPAKRDVVLHIRVARDVAEAEIAEVQASVISKVESKDRGFRYRLPVNSRMTLHGDTGGRAAAERLLDQEFAAEIAQFGPTLAVPRKASVWGGTVTAGLVPATGRLKAFKTDSGESPSTTIINSLATEATRDRELAELQRQAAELEARVKIRDNTKKLETPDTP